MNLTPIAKALTAAGIRRPAVVLRGTLHPTRVRRAYLAACAYAPGHRTKKPRRPKSTYWMLWRWRLWPAT